MEKKKVESILVFGDATVGNPDLRYVVGASLARGGIYVKRQSHDPTLIVSNIDVGSARLGRVRNIRTYSDYGLERLSGKYDRDEARARFYEKIIRDTGASGPIVLAGRNETSNSLLLIDSLRKRGINVVGEKTPTLPAPGNPYSSPSFPPNPTGTGTIAREPTRSHRPKGKSRRCTMQYWKHRHLHSTWCVNKLPVAK